MADPTGYCLHPFFNLEGERGQTVYMKCAHSTAFVHGRIPTLNHLSAGITGMPSKATMHYNGTQHTVHKCCKAPQKCVYVASVQS